MSDKSRRRGATQTAPCSLCGVLVDVRDLVQPDVQGMRGFYVCSTHKWEAKVRFKPSFLDRGGVGQVPDMTEDPIPAPGPGGGWLPDSESFFLDLEDSTTETPNRLLLEEAPAGIEL